MYPGQDSRDGDLQRSVKGSDYVSNPKRGSGGENGSDASQNPEHPAIVVPPLGERDQDKRQDRNCEASELSPGPFCGVISKKKRDIQERK
jgi:hypothetical protein